MTDQLFIEADTLPVDGAVALFPAATNDTLYGLTNMAATDFQSNPSRQFAYSTSRTIQPAEPVSCRVVRLA